MLAGYDRFDPSTRDEVSRTPQTVNDRGNGSTLGDLNPTATDDAVDG